MKKPHQSARILSHAEAVLAQARRLHGDNAPPERPMAEAINEHRRQMREERMRRFVADQVRLAHHQLPLPSAEVETDSATRFARKVRRLRSIV